MNKLTRPEIKLAAEAIAATAWERGASRDGTAKAIERAFRRDGDSALTLAKSYAAAALEAWETTN